MEITIMIGEEKLRLRANAATAIFYKQQFKSDILKDTLAALGGIEAILQLQDLESAENYQQLQTLIDGIDTVLIYQFVWVWAKTVDRNFPNFYEWISEVDLPPITNLIQEEGFVELLTKNIYRKKK